MIYELSPNRVFRSYTGGARISAFDGTKPLESDRFPEDWIASCAAAFNPGRDVENEGLSRVADGRFLRDIIADAPAGALGKSVAERFGGRMPVLLKLLDASERLAIQVHPTIKFAREAFGSPFGKTESWYALGGGHVYIGFREGITREKWVDMFRRQDIPAMLGSMHRFELRPGELVYVPGGVPHAIDAGTFVAELQEPTDLMAVPERVTPSGTVLDERKLHCGLGFDKMFDMFVYDGTTESEARGRYFVTPERVGDAEEIILGLRTTDRFEIRRFTGDFALSEGRFAVVLSLGGGEISADGENIRLRRGSKLFITADSGAVSARGAELLVCGAGC